MMNGSTTDTKFNTHVTQLGYGKKLTDMYTNSSFCYRIRTFHTTNLFVQPQHTEHQDNDDNKGEEKQHCQDGRHSYGST